MTSSVVDALRGDVPIVAVELRPPRATLGARAGMDAWIDTYHSVRGLTRQGRFVFLTDSAVGTREEDNLRHLVINLGDDAPRSRVVPFLTSKHTLDECLSYADRAAHHGFPALVVLGGDTRVGPSRCVEHAWQLRAVIRARQPGLVLGGWANPHAAPDRQVDYLLAREHTAEFFLTQIVSHHHAGQVERFVTEGVRRGLALPGVFGVFYYRSASSKTLAALSEFLPVPAEALRAEFGNGASADEICARTLRTLMNAGARHFYISNLPIVGTSARLASVLGLAGLGP